MYIFPGFAPINALLVNVEVRRTPLIPNSGDDKPGTVRDPIFLKDGCNVSVGVRFEVTDNSFGLI